MEAKLIKFLEAVIENYNNYNEENGLNVVEESKSLYTVYYAANIHHYLTRYPASK